MKENNYKKFALMLGASFVIMYTVMFLNVDRLDHVYLSLTRVYMTLLMVSPMALLMLFLMSHMYKNKKLNALIGALSAAVFVIVLLLLRTQTFIGDDEYIKAMIPHHSSAILTSQEADIKDPELKKLAEEIIKTQKEEIAQMKGILHKND
ncbi:DUF305 domain-containing protein [Pontibacter sp. JH31]|uniref:DUF305 domain-containing protein n=1 Tax=Pontibacter aquaedesilientis TaxID=2766980 RepID=A0ABR7XDW1_9BACT|nr:DUF305 domain-containing protein [Pontibacter aquaedesilientis]MBD1396469.1 DUF305 domain-containing protein [Pontibacter aquaedesilientis]